METSTSDELSREDAGRLGHRAARGMPVDLEPVRMSAQSLRAIREDYASALTMAFDAATQLDTPVGYCEAAASALIQAAQHLIGCCILCDTELLDWGARECADTRDSLLTLAPHHRRTQALREALRNAGAGEFRGRWAALVAVL